MSERLFALVNDQEVYLLSDGTASHFSTHELRCRCGCGACQADQRLIDTLEAIREHIGSPVFVHSGIRCSVYNHRVGGALTSQHLPRDIYGEIVETSWRVPASGATRACDITTKVLTPRMLQGLIRQNREVWGVTGLGCYPGFTHVDVRDGRYTTWKG